MTNSAISLFTKRSIKTMKLSAKVINLKVLTTATVHEKSVAWNVEYRKMEDTKSWNRASKQRTLNYTFYVRASIDHDDDDDERLELKLF